MANVTKNTKPLVTIDWTATEGDTPFYQQATGSQAAYYGVAVDTQLVQWSELAPKYGSPYTSNRDLLLSGTNQILDFYNKVNWTPEQVGASIPLGASGTFVPLRPSGTIKVLVKIPDVVYTVNNQITFDFDESIPNKPAISVGAYDEIYLNTYNFTQKAQNISKLLEKYNTQAKNFDGRIYDFNFAQQATKITNFASLLIELVNNNKLDFSQDQSDLVMIGVSSSYEPLYAQINTRDELNDLSAGFSQFKHSQFVDSNTLFLYKHFEEINKIAAQQSVTDPGTSVDPSIDWQKFLNLYIKFPKAIIEYSGGRPNTPEPDPTLKKEVAKANSEPVVSASELQRLELRMKSKEFKQAMEAKQKASRDWIGDNVLGNLDKTINQLHTLEDMYHKVLDKTGMTYIVKAALRCLKADLPFDDIKDLLGDIRVFTEGVLEILKIPVITLDDIFPTVDIMWDIMKSVFKAIYEAVKKALWEMLKQIIYELLDNCGDPCQAGFGGVNLGALLAKPPGEALAGLALPALAVAGKAAASGVEQGLNVGASGGRGNLNANSQKFLNNLNKKVSTEQLQTLTSPVAPVVGQATGAASTAITNSPIYKFLEKCSQTLTCGETQKLLEGKGSPQALKIVQALAEQDPNPVFQQLLGDQNGINNFFESAGKIIDEDELAAQIEALSDFDPDPCGTISDRRDSELRCALLAGKGVPTDFCDEQETASRNRAIERIKQLQKFLEDPNKTLQDAVPPIYCTYRDGKIVQGLVSNDHPSFNFMMKTTLDNSFAGIYNAFTYDVLRVPDVMQGEIPGPDRQIDRVIDARWDQCDDVNGPGMIVNNGWRMMNPEFEMAVEGGYKPDPPYWKCPAMLRGKDQDEFTVVEDHLRKTIQYNYDAQEGIGAFANSPTKPYKIPTTEIVYSPGMSGSSGVYGKFQTSYFDMLSTAPPPTPLPSVDNALARNRLAADKTMLQLSIPNKIKGDLQKYGNSAVLNSMVESARNDPKMAAAVRDLGFENLFGPDRYALTLASFSDAPDGKDKFSIRVTGDMMSGPDAEIYRKMFILDIPQSAGEVIAGRSLDEEPVGTDYSTKEKHFAQFLEKIWSEGENIYSGSVDELVQLTANDYPVTALNYCRGFSVQNSYNASSTGFQSMILSALLGDQSDTWDIKSLFEELLRDLMAITLTEVGTSKLLEENAINLFSLLNLAPMPRPGCPDLSLLGLEMVKDEIIERYKDAQCIESSFPNVTGLGDNRDNAFESAALFGIVTTTVRTYAVEMVLKTLPTFSTLQVKDLDDLFIIYLREHMTAEIRAKGYLDNFISQTLKAYNLVAAGIEGQAQGLETSITDFNKAIDYFIRKEMRYVVEKVLSISGLTVPMKSINNLLIQDESEGWLPDFEAGDGIRVSAANLPHTYHVENFNKILGIKDPTNGTFIIEKYIRAEAGDNWVMPANAQRTSQVYDVSNYYSGEWSDLFLASGNQGATGPAITPPPPSSLASTEIVEANECSPGGEVVVGPAGPPTTPDPNTVGRYFNSLRYGLRLVCKSGINSELSNTMNLPTPSPHAIVTEQPNFDFSKAHKNKSYLVADEPEKIVPATNLPNYNRFVFPIACVERDIDPNTPISDINNNERFFMEGYQVEFPQLLCMLKKTREYNFMFDYCFPLKRLVSMAVLYNAVYVLPFPGLNDVFTNTKEQLRLTFGSMLKSGNYQFKDPQTDQQRQATTIANGEEPPGLDYGVMAVQFLFGLLRGAGEAFSPNIAIARKIQILSEMIGPGLVKVVNKAKQVGNRANEVAQGDLAGGNSGTPFEAITECDLPPPFPLPEIPIIFIALGLVPIDLFSPLAGPPLGPLGYFYLQWFHSEYAHGRKILGKTEKEKERDRCAIKFQSPGKISSMLTNQPGDCPPIYPIPNDISDCDPGDPETRTFTSPSSLPAGGVVEPEERGFTVDPEADDSGDDDSF